MINFDEELEQFQPALLMDELHGELNEMTDMLDLLQSIKNMATKE